MTHVHNYQRKHVRETKIPQQVHIAAAFGGISENRTVLIIVIELQPSEMRKKNVVGINYNHHGDNSMSDQPDWTCICSSEKCDADGRRL